MQLDAESDEADAQEDAATVFTLGPADLKAL